MVFEKFLGRDGWRDTEATPKNFTKHLLIAKDYYLGHDIILCFSGATEDNALIYRGCWNDGVIN